MSSESRKAGKYFPLVSMKQIAIYKDLQSIYMQSGVLWFNRNHTGFCCRISLENPDSLDYEHTKYFAHLATSANPSVVI